VCRSRCQSATDVQKQRSDHGRQACHRLLTCSFNRTVDEAVAAAYAYFQPES